MIRVGTDTVSISNGVSVGGSGVSFYTPAVAPDEEGFILLESGDAVLLETDDKVIKE